MLGKGSLTDLCHAAGLLWLLHRGMAAMYSSSRSWTWWLAFPATSLRWADLIFFMCGLGPPFAVSGVLHNFGGEKAEAPSMPDIIPGVGSQPSL
jgi:hypothetical protein